MRLGATLIAALACACAPVPKRVESLGLPPAATDLSLVIVPTENTKNAIAFNREHNAQHHPFEDVSQINKDQPLNTLVAALNANFKSVVKVESLNEAKAIGADLIGMLDYYFRWGITYRPLTTQVVRGTLRIEENLLLLDPSGKTVAKISASAERDAEKEPELFDPFQSVFKHFGVPPISILWVETQDDVLTRFATALSSSTELRDYARRRPAVLAPAFAALAQARPQEARSEVDSPRYGAKEDASKFAVVVGVEDYQSVAPAAFAERDAKAVREHLRALGYPDRNVVLLTGREAGKSGLEKYLESWLPRNADERSRVFVYFAGHGAPDVKTGQPYLLPWDADPAFLDATGYPVRRLYDGLAKLGAKRVVVAFDAGFSGAGGRSALAKGARPLVSRVDDAGPRSDRIVVLSAASGDEVTGADKTQGHGLFTYFLLKGLNERGGTAPVKALYDYLKPRVQDAARRDSRDQTPRLLADSASAGDSL